MSLRAQLNNNAITSTLASSATSSAMHSSFCTESSCNRRTITKPTPTITKAPSVPPLIGSESHKCISSTANKGDESNAINLNFITSVKSLKPHFRTTRTFGSNSASDLLKSVINVRPQTLNVHQIHETPTEYTKKFLGEVLNTWRAKACCNVVPTDNLEESFQLLSFHPSNIQIKEMVKTAENTTRKACRRQNGLTVGEFSAIAAELKRFRSSLASKTMTPIGSTEKLHLSTSSLTNESDNLEINASKDCNCSDLRSTKSLSNTEDCKKATKKNNFKKNSTTSDKKAPIEVFLGGSCNPTTWRADVAIPALQALGISFYNPQVSDWTPDLMDLEHRAKEKASVLFFVMDSETRASAGAIEAAHIAGQNCKQLVLVLHPYKPNQHILNEPISQREYQDLIRNQLILRELVTRRGLPVLDNIPLGLQRTKEILAGIRDPPPKISSILIALRGAFDRASPFNDVLTIEQCRRSLLYLGYAESLLNMENLKGVIATQQEYLKAFKDNMCAFEENHCGEIECENRQQSSVYTNSKSRLNDTSSPGRSADNAQSIEDTIDFELFCIVSAYYSVLQQEIHESGCISPIKGTNVIPPPVYLTNMQEETFSLNTYAGRNISRNSSNSSVLSGSGSGSSIDEKYIGFELPYRSQNSGTFSPLPSKTPKSRSSVNLNKLNRKVVVNYETVEESELNAGTTTTFISSTRTSTGILSHANEETNTLEDESDSNDSVFSSNSSINSFNCNYNCSVLGWNIMNQSNLELRDIYLGGSCSLRTKWRQEIAVPFLKSKGVTYRLPALHESMQYTTQNQCWKNKERNICDDIPMLPFRANLYNPSLLDASRVLLFVITNKTRSLAPMTLAAHCIGLMYNVVLCVQMLPEDCVIGNEKLTPLAIKDYNRGRSYLIDLAKRQGVPVFNDLNAALQCAVEKVQKCN